MARAESSLVTKRMPWHANMTEMNHLGAALIAKPDKLEGKVNQLFTAHKYSDNPLSSILINSGREETRNSTTWEWPLRGATTRPLVVQGTHPSLAESPCLGRTTAPLWLDENWYLPGDVLTPGASDKRYQVRIQEGPTRLGDGWVYTVRAMNDATTFSIPVGYFASGTQWSKMFSQYEEAAQDSGSTQYSLPLELASRMSRYRKMYEVTGDAANEVLAVRIPTSDGKYVDSWVKYAEIEYWMQWYRELERGLWYSRSTDTVLGSNGRPIYSGPGIQELLEDSHVHYYSHLNSTLIEEYLMDIFYSRVKPGSKRKIKAFTGEYGMILFHRAIQDWAAKTGFIQIVQDLTFSKTTSEYNSNALQAGYQFTKYLMANGAELELVHNPLYDDREINFEIDTVTGYPVESMRFTFLDFSGEGVESNIKIMNKRNGYKLVYVAGMQNPYGPVNNQLGSHSGDYYEMHVQKQIGIHIEDTSRMGELILSRN